MMPRAWKRAVILPLILPVAVLISCQESPNGISDRPEVAGTVTTAGTGDPVAGAVVSIGAATATTGADGRFELAGFTAGPARLRCIATGFEDFEVDIAVPPEGITRDITLTPFELSALAIQAEVGRQGGYVYVFGAGRVINDAVVTVNGVTFPPMPVTGASPPHNIYQGTFEFPAPVGSTFHLTASAGGLTVEANGEVPEAPVLTAPAPGTVFSPADSVTFTWTSATDPDRFEVWTAGFGGFCCGVFPAPASARELKIAVSGVGDSFSLVAINEGSFTGPADPGSRMSIVNRSPGGTILIQP